MTAALRVEGPLGLNLLVAEQAHADRVYEAVVIRPGVYVPGFGPQKGKRVRFTADVLQRIARTLEGKRVAFDTHKDGAEVEIGFVRNARWQPDERGGALRADLVFQSIRALFADALAFVEGRRQAKMVPNVSVELVEQAFRAAEGHETAFFDLDVVHAELDGVAVLTRGACNDDMGCGIGLCPHVEYVDQDGNPLTPRAGAAPANAPQGQGEPDMNNTPPTSGGPSPCGGHQVLMEQLKREQDRSVQLQSELDKAKSGLTKAEGRAKELETEVLGFNEAEAEAYREAIEQALPEDASIDDIVDEKATVGELKTAFAALTLGKARTGLTAGKGQRRRAGPIAGSVVCDADGDAGDEEDERDGFEQVKQTQERQRGYYDAMRARLGLTADTAKRVPRAMQLNDDELGLPDPLDAPQAPAGKGGA